MPATQSEETVLVNGRNQACITHLVSPVIQKSSDTCVTSCALKIREVFMRQYMKEKRTNKQFREKENKRKQPKRKDYLEKSPECQRRATKTFKIGNTVKVKQMEKQAKAKRQERDLEKVRAPKTRFSKI